MARDGQAPKAKAGNYTSFLLIALVAWRIGRWCMFCSRWADVTPGDDKWQASSCTTQLLNNRPRDSVSNNHLLCYRHYTRFICWTVWPMLRIKKWSRQLIFALKLFTGNHRSYCIIFNICMNIYTNRKCTVMYFFILKCSSMNVYIVMTYINIFTWWSVCADM
jgi:hypothetical protein